MSETAQESQHRQIVTFSLGEEKFGVTINDVQEIIRMPQIVKVPKAPDFIEGVLNLRGKILPVIDLRTHFEIAKTAEDSALRVVIIEIDGTLAGLIVDAVHEVMNINESDCEEVPDMVSSDRQRLLSGIVKQNEGMILLLDCHRLLTDKELTLLKNAAKQ